MDRFTGGCLCGNVRIVASGRPYRVGVCRCLDCRKHHGALFHASAIFPQEAVTIAGETADYAGRFFCPRCGSSVFARTADEIEVNIGSLDAPDQLMPRRSKISEKFRADDMRYVMSTFTIRYRPALIRLGQRVRSRRGAPHFLLWKPFGIRFADTR